MDNRRQSGLWDHNAQTGEFERKAIAGPYQYYKQPTTTSDKRRSFSQRSADPASDMKEDAYRAATKNGLERSTSIKKGPTYDSDQADVSHTEQLGDDVEGPRTNHELQQPQISTSKHISELDPEHDKEHNNTTYDDDEDDEIPENLRRKAWSPEPESPVLPEKDLPTRHASNASQHIRRGSVPDRSPLQHLEAKLGDMGKEEKRARMEEAERKIHKEPDTIGGASNENRRSISDAGRRSEDSRQQRRSVSDEMPRKSQSHRRGESGSEKFRRATDALRSGLNDDNSVEPDSYFAQTARPITSTSREVKSIHTSKSDGRRDGHSARSSAGMSTATTVAGAFENDAAARGKAAHERRKREAQAKNASRSVQPEVKQVSIRPTSIESRASKQSAVKPIDIDPRGASWGPSTGNPASPTSTRTSGEIPRTRSKKLQKQPPAVYQPTSASNSRRPDSSRSSDTAQPSSDRTNADQSKNKSSLEPLEPDIITRDAVKTGSEVDVPYSIPPQTQAARQAKERVSFAPDVVEPSEREDGHKHRFHDMFSDHHVQARGYQSKVAALEEWKSAKTLKLADADMLLDDGHDSNRDSAWWESNGRRPPQSTSARTIPYEEQATSFDPPLFLKCGPLLRFTGLRKEQSVATTWRGSIMILTEDASSDLRQAPILRLFAQDMELYKTPAHTEHVNGDRQHDQHHDHDDEDDAITGQMKISRIGRPIFVRSVQEIQHGVDLSRQENKNGLFSAIAPEIHSNNDQTQTHTSQSRVNGHDGEALDKYQEVQAHRLHVEHGCTFWRFNVEIELGSRQRRIAYRINNGPAVGFWIPSKHESMNIMFHSCNGFSLSVNPDDFCGPDPLWRDVLNRHQKQPFHVMVGGGDQIYNDSVIRDTTHFKEWLQIKNSEHKYHADFTVEMQEELETFYFERYAMWFSQGLFGMANAQIPMVNIYDDHDEIDGWGSYPHHFMSSPVFTGLGAIAFKYYMLFQHQALPTETTKDEPSWLLGKHPGPYVNELNRSVFVWMGPKVAFLGIDCRTERMRDEVLSLESYDLIFERCRAEIVKGETKHLIVLLGVPIAYPRLNFIENILTSRAMDPIKALGRTGALGGFVNKFDGGVEILDDLDDHWTAKHHKRERNWFIQELQELAAEKSVRVTILGGDVHLGAVGQFFSNKKLGLAKDKDHRYMPNIISSAIVNTPPPPMMADVLNRRNKIHHLDHETDEDMIPMFEYDVDGSKRNNRRLLPRRNFAIIKEYMPGTTPPPSPTPEQNLPTTDSSQNVNDRAYPPGSMSRRRSLGRGPGSLIRRLSLRGRNQSPTFIPVQPKRPFSFHEQTESNESNAMQRSSSMTTASDLQRPNTFQRRPTNLSLKEARRAAAKGGAEDDEGNLPGYINLEHGLDISLCMEVDQHDAAGRTVPYRLLVPALWYEGSGDKNTLTLPARRPSLFQRMTSGRRQKQMSAEEADYDHDASEDESMVGIPTQQEPATVHRGNELADMQAVAAGAGRGAEYGAGGAFGQPRSSFQSGYDLKAPPIGSTPHEQQTHSSSHRESQTQATRSQSQEIDTASMTESEENPSYEGEDEDTSPQEAWRYSKAERFFGIGDEGGPANNSATLPRSSSDTAKKRSSWMLWKRGGSLRNWPGSAQ